MGYSQSKPPSHKNNHLYTNQLKNYYCHVDLMFSGFSPSPPQCRAFVFYDYVALLCICLILSNARDD